MRPLKRKARIRYRIRKKVSGTAERPRLSVFRSNNYVYVQAVDDVHGVTLAAASSREASVDKSKTKVEQAKEVGKLIAERLLSQNLTKAVFDRGGYLYHGRVKAVAEGAREAGLTI